MTKKFKPGDIVLLLSGGPRMTVKAVHSGQRDIVDCQWFSGSKLNFGQFAEDSLKMASESKNDDKSK